ncbi:sensor histidine kinase [Arcicella sp. DC2W]|uniref:Sensor histidine kinase n=1 Tax=Arcicella gelida TaxID=2984195 RepID=A0ABU5S182_9BACT|nr:sensor histidine kinase [Arcicella sp. DC2W]MEA5402224.1 sensor histidine kinase [Arcicella sp. DC2W]
MNQKKKVHIIVWALYVIYYQISYVIGYLNKSDLSTSLIILINCLCWIIIFYNCVLFIFPKFLLRKQYTITVILCILNGAILTVVNIFFIVTLFPDYPNAAFNQKVLLLHFWNAQIYTIYALGYYFAQKSINQQIEIATRDREIARQRIAIAEKEAKIAKQELEIAILAKEKALAEMAFLRAQINPHFMYNTLNMIFERVRKASREAGDIVLAFAEMLRYATSTKSQEDEVDLEGELDFVKQYIELHLQRFHYKVYIDFEEDGDFSYHRIVPMVLITIVENGIKHGVFDEPDIAFRIRATLMDEVFVFTATNKKNPYPNAIADAGQTGIGIKNIKKRLLTTYPAEAHSIEIIESEEDYTVVFTVNFNLLKK